MKKWLVYMLLIVAVGLTACDMLNPTNNANISIDDLEIQPDFTFNTVRMVDITLQSVNSHKEAVPNAYFRLYKENPLNPSSKKLMTASTDGQGNFASTIALPTYAESIFLESVNGYRIELPIIKLDNQKGSIDGSFLFDDLYKGTRSDMADFPYKTIWAVDDDPAKLYYHSLSGGGLDVYLEGELQGVTGTKDVEAFAIDSTGIIYFMNNVGTSKLYKIDTLQIDKDETTPVTATYIGDTGLSAGSADDEICALQFAYGTLYGLGKQSKKVYSVNTSDGSVTELANLNVTGTFRTDGIATDYTSGISYLIKTFNSNSELWKFTSFPSGGIEYVLTITGSGKVEALTSHPNGYLYAADSDHWYEIDPDAGTSTQILTYSSDIEGMDFFYNGEVENSPLPDSDGDGVPDDWDDYPADPDRAYDDYYPSEGEYGTVAYEDLWPNKGDYDINDVLIDININSVRNANYDFVEVIFDMKLRAHGASLTSGFAIQLPDFLVLDGSNIVDTGYNATLMGDGRTLEFCTNIRNVFKQTYPAVGGEYINTSLSFPEYSPIEWTVTIPVTATTGVASDPWDIAPFNPFIFVGDLSEGHEIHLSNYPPTTYMDDTLFGTGDDASNPSSGIYFRTSTYLPWCISIAESAEYALETIEIVDAFLHFADWAQSSGSQYSNWYKDQPGYLNWTYIYNP